MNEDSIKLLEEQGFSQEKIDRVKRLLTVYSQGIHQVCRNVPSSTVEYPLV